MNRITMATAKEIRWPEGLNALEGRHKSAKYFGKHGREGKTTRFGNK